MSIRRFSLLLNRRRTNELPRSEVTILLGMKRFYKIIFLTLLFLCTLLLTLGVAEETASDIIQEKFQIDLLMPLEIIIGADIEEVSDNDLENEEAEDASILENVDLYFGNQDGLDLSSPSHNEQPDLLDCTPIQIKGTESDESPDNQSDSLKIEELELPLNAEDDLSAIEGSEQAPNRSITLDDFTSSTYISHLILARQSNAYKAVKDMEFALTMSNFSDQPIRVKVSLNLEDCVVALFEKLGFTVPIQSKDIILSAGEEQSMTWAFMCHQGISSVVSTAFPVALDLAFQLDLILEWENVI